MKKLIDKVIEKLNLVFGPDKDPAQEQNLNATQTIQATAYRMRAWEVHYGNIAAAAEVHAIQMPEGSYHLREKAAMCRDAERIFNGEANLLEQSLK